MQQHLQTLGVYARGGGGGGMTNVFLKWVMWYTYWKHVSMKSSTDPKPQSLKAAGILHVVNHQDIPKIYIPQRARYTTDLQK